MDSRLRNAHRRYLATRSPEDLERLLGEKVRGGVSVDTPEMRNVIEDPHLARFLREQHPQLRGYKGSNTLGGPDYSLKWSGPSGNPYEDLVLACPDVELQTPRGLLSDIPFPKKSLVKNLTVFTDYHHPRPITDFEGYSSLRRLRYLPTLTDGILDDEAAGIVPLLPSSLQYLHLQTSGRLCIQALATAAVSFLRELRTIDLRSIDALNRLDDPEEYERLRQAYPHAQVLVGSYLN